MILGRQSVNLLVVVLSAIIICAFGVEAGDTMTLEVDVRDLGLDSEDPGSETVSIEVPSFIDLGSIDENGFSEEIKIYINNTGTSDIKVTPELVDQNEDVFSYLFFREYKTSGGSNVLQKRIGEFSFNISAPTSGSRSKYIYMQLDLSDADLELDSDLIGHNSDVRFIATAQ